MSVSLCPRCHGFAQVRLVFSPVGCGVGVRHWVCDHCKIGWFDNGKSKGKIYGSSASARSAYAPKSGGVE